MRYATRSWAIWLFVGVVLWLPGVVANGQGGETPGGQALEPRKVRKLLRANGKGMGLVSAVCFSPDGTRLVTGSFWNVRPLSIWVWDANTGQLDRTLPTQLGSVTSVAYSADGRWIASAGHSAKSVVVME